MAREKKTERPTPRQDELTTFVNDLYKFINVDKSQVIRNTVRNVRGNKGALKEFVQSIMTCATVQNMEITDIELGTILFKLLLNRPITPTELGNMVEYLEGHTRSDMISKILCSQDWYDRLNELT